MKKCLICNDEAIMEITVLDSRLGMPISEFYCAVHKRPRLEQIITDTHIKVLALNMNFSEYSD